MEGGREGERERERESERERERERESEREREREQGWAGVMFKLFKPPMFKRQMFKPRAPSDESCFKPFKHV